MQTEVFTTIFDHCLYGQTAVIADILDADVNGDVDPHSVNIDEGTPLFTYLSKKPKLVCVQIYLQHSYSMIRMLRYELWIAVNDFTLSFYLNFTALNLSES